MNDIRSWIPRTRDVVNQSMRLPGELYHIVYGDDITELNSAPGRRTRQPSSRILRQSAESKEYSAISGCRCQELQFCRSQIPSCGNSIAARSELNPPPFQARRDANPPCRRKASPICHLTYLTTPICDQILLPVSFSIRGPPESPWQASFRFPMAQRTVSVCTMSEPNLD